jgi:ubiquinone/menaquinone biosynthesis C-methylase UbiE
VRQSVWEKLISNSELEVNRSMSILDIGCGPGSFLAQFEKSIDSTKFVGLDVEGRYISMARKLFPSATWHRIKPGDSLILPNSFDFVVISAVLHHASNEDVREILELARRSLRRGGVAVSVDPVFHDRQTRLSKLFVGLDRGRFIRTEDELAELWSLSWGSPVAKQFLFTRQMRIPYSHSVFIAQKL